MFPKWRKWIYPEKLDQSSPFQGLRPQREQKKDTCELRNLYTGFEQDIRVCGFFSGYATTLCLLLGPLPHNTAPAGWKHDDFTFEDMMLLSLDSYFSSYQYPPTIHGIMPTVGSRSQHGSSAFAKRASKRCEQLFHLSKKQWCFFCIILIAFNLFIF